MKEATACKAKRSRSIAHKGYNLKGALNTQLGLRLNPDTSKLFCSQLVAEAYERAGVTLVHGVPADMVTPGDLQQKSVLTALAAPLKEIPTDQIAEAEAFLDRDKAYIASPMWKEMIASREAVEAVKDRVRALTVPDVNGIPFPPGNLGELLDVLQIVSGRLADEVAEALRQELRRRDYFNLFVESFLPVRMKIESDVARYRAGTLSEDDTKAFAEWRRIASLEDTRDCFRHNATLCQKVYSRTKQRLWLDLAAMYFINADGLDLLITLAAEISA